MFKLKNSCQVSWELCLTHFFTSLPFFPFCFSFLATNVKLWSDTQWTINIKVPDTNSLYFCILCYCRALLRVFINDGLGRGKWKSTQLQNSDSLQSLQSFYSHVSSVIPAYVFGLFLKTLYPGSHYAASGDKSISYSTMLNEWITASISRCSESLA